MTGRRTGILMHIGRVISKTPKKMVVWLTGNNLHKLDQRLVMTVYFGKMGYPWEKDGEYRLAKKMRSTKHDRGLKYYKCELARVVG